MISGRSLGAVPRSASHHRDSSRAARTTRPVVETIATKSSDGAPTVDSMLAPAMSAADALMARYR